MNSNEPIPKPETGQEPVIPIQPDGRRSIRKYPSKTMTVDQLITQLKEQPIQGDFPVVVALGNVDDWNFRPVAAASWGVLGEGYGSCCLLHLEKTKTLEDSG